MCFSKGGLGIFFSFGSWLFASPNLAKITQSLLDMEEHAHCVAIMKKNVTENEDITWHLSMVQLISGVIHYAFLLPLILLVIYSFVYVFTFKIARNAVSVVNSEHSKVKLLQALTLSLSKAGNFLIGGVFFITLFLIYFRGVFSRMSSIDTKMSNATCTFVQEKAKWTICIAYLVFSLVLLVVSQFSFFAYKFREAIMLSFYPELPVRPAAVAPALTSIRTESINLEEPIRARPWDTLSVLSDINF